MKWTALSEEKISERVNQALAENKNYHNHPVLGPPGSYLDPIEFSPKAPFLKDAPYLRSLIMNPNHIGCHTLKKESSPMFKGTQQIEVELINLCAENIFSAKAETVDGYVASGGTEANIEALWIYRNYYKAEYGADTDQIGVIFSEDTHYSVAKGCDLLNLEPIIVPVDQMNRSMPIDELKSRISSATTQKLKYFILVLNVGTTMFGSVDPVDSIGELMESMNLTYKIHLDAAFGGLVYPFSSKDKEHSFANHRVSSVSIDGHKLLQTPYGTGLFMIRKGFMKYVGNTFAQYVPGLDYTLSGSRSGANAIVMWMVLRRYGRSGWQKKIDRLLELTNYCCAELKKMGIEFYRNPFFNIIAIKANQIPAQIASRFELVADSYERPPLWYKIAVMEHVNKRQLSDFIKALHKSKAALV